MPGFLNREDRPFLQGNCRVGEYGCKAVDDMGGSSIMEAEDDDTHVLPLRKSRDLPEIKVKGQDGSRFGDGFCEDLPVRHPMQSLVPQVDCIVALAAQPLNDANIHPHVGKKPHAAPLTR